jgi:hypothetical protein
MVLYRIYLQRCYKTHNAKHQQWYPYKYRCTTSDSMDIDMSKLCMTGPMNTTHIEGLAYDISTAPNYAVSELTTLAQDPHCAASEVISVQEPLHMLCPAGHCGVGTAQAPLIQDWPVGQQSLPHTCGAAQAGGQAF